MEGSLWQRHSMVKVPSAAAATRVATHSLQKPARLLRAALQPQEESCHRLATEEGPLVRARRVQYRCRSRSASGASPDDTQVTELAAEQQSPVGEEDGFVWSDTF